MTFLDRADAGRKLAAALNSWKDQDPVVLALPRGGVAVAAPIAVALAAPLDIVLVRKIGAPSHPELAMGAVVDGDEPVVVRNEDVIRAARVGPQQFEEGRVRALAEIERRRQLYLGDAARAPINARSAIVVDDGVATGATAIAALRAVRRREPRSLTLATPVAAPDALALLRAEADDVVCLEAPAAFEAVGAFYADFRQLDDDDVAAILAAHRPAATP
ncbi:MAG: phosphoribosyltransferase, partial [Hyphomicrobiales bacterium]|nr:phosphoribosyltransferase [Hyphomicrobiales bacterium]MBV8662590.1 phosphoribosyltransferase [Hyphomicrobiales bacterium]